MKSLLLNTFEQEGYTVVPNVLTEDEVSRFRKISDNYFLKCPSLENDGGKCLPGFAGASPELGEIDKLHEDKRIKTVVSQILGKNFIFAEHSDLHQNKLTGWHRDLLAGEYQVYQAPDVWSEHYQIIKVCFLLQDHTDNTHGLWFKEGSNKDGKINPQQEIGVDIKHVFSKAVDMIIFDQRIVHRGQLSQYKEKHNEDRYLITFGYGSNNEHTWQHIRGTIARQEAQRSRMV